MNFMVTINEKSIKDTHKKRKELKHNTKDRHQIIRKESKRRNKKDLQNNPKTVTKWQ